MCCPLIPCREDVTREAGGPKSEKAVQHMRQDEKKKVAPPLGATGEGTTSALTLNSNSKYSMNHCKEKSSSKE